MRDLVKATVDVAAHEAGVRITVSALGRDACAHALQAAAQIGCSIAKCFVDDARRSHTHCTASDHFVCLTPHTQGQARTTQG